MYIIDVQVHTNIIDIYYIKGSAPSENENEGAEKCRNGFYFGTSPDDLMIA